MGTPAVQNLEKLGRIGSSLVNKVYRLTTEIPKQILIDGYPTKIKTLGDHIRKTRMSVGLEVKQFQSLLGAHENSIIGWELRKIYPTGAHLKRVVEFIDSHQVRPIPRDIMWKLCFSENPCYPKEIKTLGDRIRATRMEKFLSIKQLSQKFGVNESTVVKWELKGSQPSPDMLERIQVFLAAHRSEPPE